MWVDWHNGALVVVGIYITINAPIRHCWAFTRRPFFFQVIALGRRSLPRVDKNIDLRDHLYVLEDLPDSWTPFDILPRSARLEIEVGSGKGLFLLTAADNQPEREFLGIEIAGKYARFAAAKLARKGLTNTRVIHGDAMRLVRHHLPSDSIGAVHVYFPDPWWKKRHHKRRIMNAAFLREVERVLLPAGELHFWTDVEEYFHAALQQLAESTTLVGPQPVPERPAEHDLDYRTHFERRMRRHEKPVYRTLFLKPSHPTSDTA